MIKFTGNLRLDFEKATAEITKLKDRILGYQEQIVSLQASVRNLRRSQESDKNNIRNLLLKKMPLSRIFKTALLTQRLFLITMAVIPVLPHHRHR